MEERRRVERRAQDFDVTCYIDGAKLEAHVLDIGSGGVFVSTDTSRPVPVGALVGIVFASEAVKMATTFMFGRVVRKQEAPVRGFGVCWEKAVSAGKPGELRAFLASLISLVDVEIEQEIVGTSSQGVEIRRCVYRFPERPVVADVVEPTAAPGVEAGQAESVALSGGRENQVSDDVAVPVADATPDLITFEAADTADAAPVAMPAAPSGRRRVPSRAPQVANVAPSSDIFSCLRNLDVSDEEISAVRITTGPASPSPASRRRQPRPEPIPVITMPAVNRSAVDSGAVFRGGQDVIIPCRLDASIFVIDSSVPVVLTGLGQTSAVIKSRFMPVDDTQVVTLVIIIGTRKGDVALRCHGRISLIERGAESGFRMAFSSVEEGDSPGVLERYLKWLEFNGVPSN